MRWRRIAMPRWMWARMCCEATALGTISRGPCPRACACAAGLKPELGVASIVMVDSWGGLFKQPRVPAARSGAEAGATKVNSCQNGDCATRRRGLSRPRRPSAAGAAGLNIRYEYRRANPATLPLRWIDARTVRRRQLYHQMISLL